MKEFLADVKSEFLACKWWEKIWAIFLVLMFIISLCFAIYFILFEPSIPIQVIFLILWTVIAGCVGCAIGLIID